MKAAEIGNLSGEDLQAALRKHVQNFLQPALPDGNWPVGCDRSHQAGQEGHRSHQTEMRDRELKAVSGLRLDLGRFE